MPSREWISTWDSEARKRIRPATGARATRFGLPLVEWSNRGRHQGDPVPTSQSVGDLETLAVGAESVERLSAEIDTLKGARS
ncbi:MAG: hypothetical protein K0S78_3318 [Thermomicrobiales bacterium]|jgi:hypothetical protein|nr:hypothetical protein [Thermomicrobiales bacterium]